MHSPDGSSPLIKYARRRFSILLVADAVSQVGSQVTRVALPLAALIVLGASPLELGILTAAGSAAFVLVGLFAGVVVDRTRKRPILLSADLSRFVLLMSIPIAAFANMLTIWHLYAVAFLVGIATVFFDVAFQSALPNILPRSELMSGNGKLAVIRSSSESIGPAVGGFLVGIIGAPLALLADAASYLFSACCVWRVAIPDSRNDRVTSQGVLSDIRDGLRFLFRERVFLAVAMTAGLGNLWDTAWIAIAPIFIITELGQGPAAYGLLLAIGAVGGILGAAASQKLSRWLGEARYFIVAALVAGISFCLVPFSGSGWGIAPLVVGTFIANFALGGAGVAAVTFRQATCPPALLGRVTASMRLLIWGMTPIGGLVGGLLATNIGSRLSVGVIAIGMVLAALPALLSPLRNARNFKDYSS